MEVHPTAFTCFFATPPGMIYMSVESWNLRVKYQIQTICITFWQLVYTRELGVCMLRKDT